MPVRDRIGRVGAAVVEMHVVNVRRKEDLVRGIDRHGGVLPPEEGTAHRGAVGHLDPRFKDRAVVGKVNADHAFHAVDRLVLAHPDGDTGLVLDDLKIAGEHRGRSVVVGPVELDTARDPRAEHTDERGLDDVLTVEEVIPRGLVEGGKDLAADVGEHRQFDVVVFEDDGGVFFVVLLLGGRLDDDRVRIRIARKTLMHAVFGEHRQFFGRRFFIGRQYDGLDCHFGFSHDDPPFSVEKYFFYGLIVA